MRSGLACVMRILELMQRQQDGQQEELFVKVLARLLYA